MLDANPETIFPYAIPTDYLLGPDPEGWVSWSVSDDVAVALMFSSGHLLRNVRREELDVFGLDEGSAFDRAAENLTKALRAGSFQMGSAVLSDGVEIGCVQGNWMAPAAGLMIRNFYDDTSERLGTKTLAAIVLNQELIIAFSPDEATASSEALRKLVDDRFTNHRKPISRSWLLLDGGWPRAFPGRSNF